MIRINYTRNLSIWHALRAEGDEADGANVEACRVTEDLRSTERLGHFVVEHVDLGRRCAGN